MLEKPEREKVQDQVLRTKNVAKKFNDRFAVQDVSLQVPRGSIFGFIGPSGCGKTTTVRLLLGVYRPTHGSAEVFGRPSIRLSTKDRERIGYMPQLFVLEHGLTVWQNLTFVASLYGMGLRRQDRLNEVLDIVELGGEKNKKARDLSGGMQRRLSLAAAFVHEPDLLFLDEPTGGIDPVLRSKFWDHFHGMRAQGRTLFITTQYVSEAAYCDYVGVMNKGQLLLVETPENLKRIGIGGEMIRVQFIGYVSQKQIEALRRQPYIIDGRVKQANDFSLQLVVNDASEAIPLLMDWCRKQEISVENVEKVEPSFDEVFVQIIEKELDDA